MQSSRKQIIRAAYKGGVSLYGTDLVWGASTIKYRTTSERVASLLEAGCDASCAGLVDDYEYAFTLWHDGIEASGEAITDPCLALGDIVCLYDPEHGIDIMRVDMTTEAMYKMINNYKGD